MARLSEEEKRDRLIEREIAVSVRLAESIRDDKPARKPIDPKDSKRRWKQANKERVAKHSRDKYWRDPESARARVRAYAARKRERKKMLAAMTPKERERFLHREQQARWAKANPDCIADAQRKWRERQDPELFRQYDRDRYALDPEKKKARSRAYYAANKVRINAKRRAPSRAK